METFPDGYISRGASMFHRTSDLPAGSGGQGTVVWPLLLVLLAGDLLFLGLHATLSATGPAAEGLPDWHRLMSIYTDGGYAERYQYLKWIGIAGMLLLAGRRAGNRLFTALAVVFLLVFLDDALQLHERGGRILVEALPPLRPRFFRMQDLGEIVTWAALGALAVGVLVRAWRRARGPERQAARPLLILFAALLLVGIGADMLHIVLPRLAGAFGGVELKAFVRSVTGLLEDGGEMLLASAIAAISAGLLTGGRRMR
jgi:hypothetical protein